MNVDRGTRIAWKTLPSNPDAVFRPDTSSLLERLNQDHVDEQHEEFILTSIGFWYNIA